MSVIQATATDQAAPRARRNKAAKPASRRKGDDAERREKGSWYLSPEARKRLAIHATMEDKTQSDVLEEAIMGLNRYTMPAINSRAARASQPTADAGEDRQTDGVN